LLNENYVLPEFLVQYEFQERENIMTSGSPKKTHEVESTTNDYESYKIDLKSTKINIPKFNLSNPISERENVVAFPVSRGTTSDYITCGGNDMSNNNNGIAANEDLAESKDKDQSWVNQRKNAMKQKSYIFKSLEKNFHEFFNEMRPLKERLYDPGSCGGGGGGGGGGAGRYHDGQDNGGFYNN